MTVNQQLSSLGATVLQSNVSFSDAHHLNPLLCTICCIVNSYSIRMCCFLSPRQNGRRLYSSLFEVFCLYCHFSNYSFRHILGFCFVCFI